MSTNEGARLAQSIREKVEEMKKLCEKLDEGRAGRAPAGRWSPKQILSHLCGPEGVGFMPVIKTILEKDTPHVDIKAENPFFTGKRLKMTFAELLKEFEKEYTQIADFVAGLSVEQLNRKAHIPMFKETPMGEYPTLAMFVGAVGGYHMDFHINHMKEILQALGAG
jgi:hypothetical protein